MSGCSKVMSGNKIPEDSMTDEVRDFKQKKKDCDVTFLIGKEKVYASKAVLGIASPMFREMFQGNMDTVTLEDVNAKHFIEFLKCIYPDMLQDLNGTTVYWVLPFAHKYKVKMLKAKCATVIKNKIKKVENSTSSYTTYKYTEEVYKHIKLSEVYEMSELMDHCIECASACPLRSLNEAQEQYQLPTTIEMAILKARIAKLERKF